LGRGDFSGPVLVALIGRPLRGSAGGKRAPAFDLPGEPLDVFGPLMQMLEKAPPVLVSGSFPCQQFLQGHGNLPGRFRALQTGNLPVEGEKSKNSGQAAFAHGSNTP
jgi:hypothetical protein